MSQVTTPNNSTAPSSPILPSPPVAAGGMDIQGVETPPSSSGDGSSTTPSSPSSSPTLIPTQVSLPNLDGECPELPEPPTVIFQPPVQPPKVTSDGRITIIGDNGRSFPDSGVNDDILIFDGGSNDLIFGGNGNNLIWGEFGANTLIGGSGDDTIYGGVIDLLKRNRSQPLSAQMQNQPALIFGGSGNDLLFGKIGRASWRERV